MKLKTLILAAVLLAAFIAPAYAQEMPAPGTVIDKNNFKKYAHLFPEELSGLFMDGWGGLMVPARITVSETKSTPTPKAYVDYSAKNKGKYGLDANGHVTGGWARDGMPFPDLQKNDKDFAAKLMWNFKARYIWDDEHDLAGGGSFEKRKGEPVRWNTAESFWPYFRNRMFTNPKPNMENPVGLYNALVFHYKLPDSVKNTITLAYQYTDMKKPDETYLYLPSMRRVLRAEAGQRSTPMLGSTNALDDFMGGFDGRIPDFSYTFIKEQKVLQCMENKVTVKQARLAKSDLPYHTEGYELRDSYVVEIRPKDPKYPQSKKRLWIDKENLQILYCVAWDRAGKVWKVWSQNYRKFPVLASSTAGEKFAVIDGTIGVDLQFGMATYYASDNVINTGKYSYSDVTPANLLKLAR